MPVWTGLGLANHVDAAAVAPRMGRGDAGVTLKRYAHALRRRDVDAANTVQVPLDFADAQRPPPPDAQKK